MPTPPSSPNHRGAATRTPDETTRRASAGDCRAAAGATVAAAVGLAALFNDPGLQTARQRDAMRGLLSQLLNICISLAFQIDARTGNAVLAAVADVDWSTDADNQPGAPATAQDAPAAAGPDSSAKTAADSDGGADAVAGAGAMVAALAMAVCAAGRAAPRHTAAPDAPGLPAGAAILSLAAARAARRARTEAAPPGSRENSSDRRAVSACP